MALGLVHNALRGPPGSRCSGLTAAEHHVALVVRLDKRVLDEVETMGEEPRRPTAEVDLVVADAEALPRKAVKEVPATSVTCVSAGCRVLQWMTSLYAAGGSQ